MKQTPAFDFVACDRESRRGNIVNITAFVLSTYAYHWLGIALPIVRLVCRAQRAARFVPLGPICVWSGACSSPWAALISVDLIDDGYFAAYRRAANFMHHAEPRVEAQEFQCIDRAHVARTVDVSPDVR